MTLMVMMLTATLRTTMRRTETKKMETAAEGKCQSPARHMHVVMIMGSCPNSLTRFADFRRIKEFLIEGGNANPSKDEVLTANLMDFMLNDMGMAVEAIEALVAKIELMWVKKMTFKDMDANNLTIFVRYTDVSGKKSCFHHAKAMNRSAVNNNVETRRLCLDVIPQLEARFAMLNKMSWRVRDDAKRNCNMLVHTRIELINNTLELQVKEPTDQYHHTIDLVKEYPSTTIPGIEYNRKTNEKRPQVFKFTGTSTPPGRNRFNNPRVAIRNPDENPSHHPRQRLEIGNSTLRGANTKLLGIRPKQSEVQQEVQEVPNETNKAKQIFRGNFTDLDQIDGASLTITAPMNPKTKVDSQNTRMLDFSNGNSVPTLPVLLPRNKSDPLAGMDPLIQQSKRSFYNKGSGSLANIPAAAGSSALSKLMEAANRSQSEENLSKSRGVKRHEQPTSETQPIVRRPPGRPRRDSVGKSAAKAKADKADKVTNEVKGKNGAIPKTTNKATKKAEELRADLKEARADNPNNIGPDEDAVEDELILSLEVKSKEDDLDFDAI